MNVVNEMSEEAGKTRKKNAAKRKIDAAGGSTMPSVPEREVDYKDSGTSKEEHRQHKED